MSKSHPLEKTKPSPITSPTAPSAIPLSFPPPNDPSWQEFADQHREFLAARPNYEKQMAERAQALAEPRAGLDSEK